MKMCKHKVKVNSKTNSRQDIPRESFCLNYTHIKYTFTLFKKLSSASLLHNSGIRRVKYFTCPITYIKLLYDMFLSY